jgi:hypothetical protein
MAFIGNTNTTQAFTPAIDYFSGNGSTTAFTLSRPIASVAQVQVVVNNVAQNPSSAFTVSGNTITFTSAPSSGTNNIYVYYTSPITQVVALPQNPQVFGNLQFSSSGARITGDFSNATPTNRVQFQSSTTNGNTFVGVIPNGVASACGFTMESDPTFTNDSFFAISLNSGSDSRINSGIRGTGTYLPMTFYTGGSERMRVDTSGNLLFNSGYGSVATAYGCRAWVNFNGTGVVAIRASGNVTSITDNGVGDYTVNFTTAMPDANYAVTGTAGDYTGGTQNRMTVDPKVYATGSIRFNVDNSSSTTDQNAVSVAIFR